MHATFSEILTRADTRECIEQFGATVRASKPNEFARYIAKEITLWGKVVRDNIIES